MSNQIDSLSKEFETLIQKTVEANRLFITEGTKFVKQLNFSKQNGKELILEKSDLIKDAFNLFVKLNIQYASNLVNLGMTLSQNFNEPETIIDENIKEEFTQNTRANKPAFILQASATAGEIAQAVFLLDSDKQEVLFCNFKQTDYTLENDDLTKYTFETNFSPQSFELMPGKSQKVEIAVKIPLKTKQGIYQTDILVLGFEHTYFSLFITATQAKTNENKKKGSK